MKISNLCVFTELIDLKPPTHCLKYRVHLIYLCIWQAVQFSSVVQSCPTLCDPMNHNTPGLPVHHQLPEFTQTHVLRVSDAIQPSNTLSSPSLLPPVPPSIRVFSNESTRHMRWPSIGVSASASVLLMNIQGLISFRIDCFDLLAVQGTL